MTLFRALTITCDGKSRGNPCKQQEIGPATLTDDRALTLATAQGWSREGDEDFCRGCTERRARRAKQAASEPRSRPSPNPPKRETEDGLSHSTSQ